LIPDIPDVPREALLAAMEEFDKGLRNTEEWSGWEQKGTYKYAIAHEGRRYPVKQIISMGTGESKTNFSGGFEAWESDKGALPGERAPTRQTRRRGSLAIHNRAVNRARTEQMA